MENQSIYDDVVHELSTRPTSTTAINVKTTETSYSIDIRNKRIMLSRRIKDNVITGVNIHLIEKDNDIDTLDIREIPFNTLISIRYA